MRNLIIFLVIIVLLGGAYFLITKKDKSGQTSYTSPVYTFVSDDKEISIQYNTDGDKAELTLDGKKYELESAVSGSGARYLSADGTVEYWEHQGEATVKVNGETVFQGERKDSSSNTPSASTGDLGGTSWVWKETLYNNDDVVTPKEKDAFVLKFGEDGKFSATTDCNNVMGSYTVDGSALSFGEDMASTKMACGEDTQEEVFTKMLIETTGHLITDDGNLALELKLDTGSVIFTPEKE